MDANAGMQLMKSGTVELIHSIPVSEQRRDKAIVAVCGEVLAGLERRKVELREQLEAQKKEITKLDSAIVKAQVPFKKKPLRFFAEDIAAFKALVRKLKWSKYTYKVEVKLSDSTGPSAELTITKANKNGYGGCYIEESRSIELPQVLTDLNKERADVSKHTCDLHLELAKIENNIAKLPQTRMLVESAVAKNDLQHDAEGREMYAAVRASFSVMMPKELQALLPAFKS